MGNENERKRNPAENREERMGHPWDDAKTGGREETVGLTNDRGFAPEGGPDSDSVGSVGVIGGSAEFLTGEQSSGQGSTPETSKGDEEDLSADRQTATD